MTIIIFPFIINLLLNIIVLLKFPGSSRIFIELRRFASNFCNSVFCVVFEGCLLPSDSKHSLKLSLPCYFIKWVLHLQRNE